MLLIEIFRGFNLSDALDILLVALVVYQIILIIRGTRAFQILLGLSFIFVVYIIARSMEFNTLHWILDHFLGSYASINTFTQLQMMCTYRWLFIGPAAF